MVQGTHIEYSLRLRVESICRIAGTEKTRPRAPRHFARPLRPLAVVRECWVGTRTAPLMVPPTHLFALTFSLPLGQRVGEGR